ncbi:hypothetical protein [Sanguibacter suaedae]|uniref:Uncharacterized protein n=1 Tax=Sanguibacter suaedae TaxID=2795737 RepID=A0A934I5F5_9MICO|nr:hypothetical protein [Sanguibacter suaedae]MBI9113522.1 hypothetical protein [Sanguibacter suaedae]
MHIASALTGSAATLSDLAGPLGLGALAVAAAVAVVLLVWRFFPEDRS